MSLLAALTLDLDLTMIPASAMSCRPELLKHRLPHAGHSELLPGPVDQGFALGMERPVLTGDGFSDWMTERTDLATLLSVSGESSPISLPSPPAPDLEAMASLLKKELEQMEDYFLEETLSPDQIFCHLYLSTASRLLWFLIISDAQESGKTWSLINDHSFSDQSCDRTKQVALMICHGCSGNCSISNCDPNLHAWYQLAIMMLAMYYSHMITICDLQGKSIEKLAGGCKSQIHNFA